MPRGPKEIVDIRSLARSHTETCIAVLAKVVSSPKAPENARVLAANSLLDRGWGKAPQQLTGADGGDITVIIRQIVANAVETEPELIEHIAADDQAAE